MTATRTIFSAGSRRLLSAAVVVGLITLAPLDRSFADSPSPTPSPSSAGTAGPAPSLSPAPGPTTGPTTGPTAGTPSAGATATPAPTASTSSRSADQRKAGTEPSLTLAVASADGPVAGAFYQDLGSYAFSGEVDGVTDGAEVTISRRTAGSDFTRVTSATVVGGRFAVSALVTEAGSFTFRATTAGDPGIDLQSNLVEVTVADSRVVLDKPVAKIDSLKNPTITGTIVPARAGVEVHVDVLVGKKYLAKAATLTDAAGKFSTSLSYGKGSIATYSIRSAYHMVNRDRWEISGTAKYARIAVIDAKITSTTAAEVAKTYRSGCPVGRSKLKTITMNFYGRDKKMHRGVLIVRSDLTTEVIRGFKKALDHRYPVAKMNNPNVYGGNDPKQMEANNTSGFNCRKVVGNPYKQSPHSYGIAIDVNTVQNPYRDSKGKWWPKNGRSYIDRTPRRLGMLVYKSYLTTSLRKDHFFWGGLWNPGRDYQHFEYRG